MNNYVCSVCGSADIQVRAWIGANDNTVHEWCDEENYRECWCEHCQEITRWEVKNMP